MEKKNAHPSQKGRFPLVPSIALGDATIPSFGEVAWSRESESARKTHQCKWEKKAGHLHDIVFFCNGNLGK